MIAVERFAKMGVTIRHHLRTKYLPVMKLATKKFVVFLVPEHLIVTSVVQKDNNGVIRHIWALPLSVPKKWSKSANFAENELRFQTGSRLLA